MRWPRRLQPCQKKGVMEGEYNFDAVMDVQ